jgi:hypothetical protein
VGLGCIRLAFLGLSLSSLGTQSVFAQVPSKPVSIDKKPYSIRILLDLEPKARIDPPRREAIVEQWLGFVERFVGAPWKLEFADSLGTFPAVAIDDLKSADLKPFASKVDKVWAIRFYQQGPTLILEGRELDVLTNELGETHRREVIYPIDAPRELFRLSLEMFTPTAEVGEQKAGGVYFLVQGGAIPVNSSLGAVASPGTIFRVLRIFPKPDGAPPEIVEVRYSYFRVERMEGPTARCEIIKGIGDPLTNRYARENKLVGLGIKPSSTPTRLRFLFKGDRQPAVGFRLVSRSIPSGLKPTDVGMTDREGRIVIKPGFADGLVSLRLMAGNDEPMLDIPVMPGETPEERTIVFEPRPLTLALEAKLDALRDAIIDVVAIRSRLESRMKARLDGEDWAGLDEAIKEFRKLTPKSDFEAKLNRIREEGEHQETESKTLVLTKNARAQLDDTKGLIDRYLDDDAIRSYEDAAQRAKAEQARPKAPAKGAKKAG